MGTKNTSKKQHEKGLTKKLPQTPKRVRGPHSRLWKWLLGILIGIVALVIAVYIAFLVSPWPGSMVIRYIFDKGGAQTSKALEKHLPSGIASVRNQQYRPGDKDAFLDVFYPEKTTTALPTVVWVHGGAWVSGNKADTDNYIKILAARGYTTVSINYSIAPEKKYPTPILQVNDALDYLQRHAELLHIDPNRIVLAGDSAGSQIVAQVATAITNPVYASELGLRPSLQADKLKGMVLNCGAYDLNLPDYNDGLAGWFLRTVLWSYSGTKDFMHDPKLRHASVVNYVTADFPPSFITAGNADPLESQSKELAKKLGTLGVTTSTLFYPANHEPKLEHEYQFNLDIKDGKQALEQIVAFLHSRTN